jgi:hypothetical protein
LEAPEKGAGTATLRLSDIAVVTYTVPIESVTPLVPDGFVPDDYPMRTGNWSPSYRRPAPFARKLAGR